MEKRDGSLIIDVRTEGEFNNGHIVGAVSCSLIPPWSFRTRLQDTLTALDPEWATNERRIIFICLSAHRSISGIKMMRELNRAHNVFQLQAGMQAWRKEPPFPEVKEESGVNAPVEAAGSGQADAAPQPSVNTGH